MKDIFNSDIFSHWVNLSYLPRWGVLLMDLFITLIAFVVSIVIGHSLWSYHFPELLIPQPWIQAIIIVFTQCVFFWVFHTYSGILRYTTFVDTIKVIFAIASNGTILLIVNLLSKHFGSGPLFLTTSLIMYVFVAICFLFIWRVIIKTTFEYISYNTSNVKKALIYGTKTVLIDLLVSLRINQIAQIIIF